jgi:hypothetical protein
METMLPYGICFALQFSSTLHQPRNDGSCGGVVNNLLRPSRQVRAVKPGRVVVYRLGILRRKLGPEEGLAVSFEGGNFESIRQLRADERRCRVLEIGPTARGSGKATLSFPAQNSTQSVGISPVWWSWCRDTAT